MLKKLINEQNRIYDCISINRQAIKYYICPCHNISYILILPLTNKMFFFCSDIGSLSPDLFPEESLIVRKRNFGMCLHWSMLSHYSRNMVLSHRP